MNKGALIETIEEILDLVEKPPESNCSCHLSAPCDDCVSHSKSREVLVNAESLLAELRKPDIEFKMNSGEQAAQYRRTGASASDGFREFIKDQNKADKDTERLLTNVRDYLRRNGRSLEAADLAFKCGELLGERVFLGQETAIVHRNQAEFDWAYLHRGKATQADMDMLTSLLAKHPLDVRAIVRAKVSVSRAYGMEKDTVCSVERDAWSQSVIGFVNQLRMNRGEPRICYSMDNFKITGFGVYDEDLKRVVKSDGSVDFDGELEPAPKKPGAES